MTSTISFAQSEPGNTEITPYGAFSFGGSFSDTELDISASLKDTESFGLILNFREAFNTQWEVLYSRQATSADITGGVPANESLDLNVHYLQLGGTYQGDGNTARPYLAATLGASHFEVESGGYDSDTFFSFSIGTGLQIRPTERIGLRLEVRAFGTLVRSGSNLFCVSDPANMNAGCAITVDGEVLWQTQAMAGLVIRF